MNKYNGQLHSALNKPSAAFIAASWVALGLGMISFCVGLWNAKMLLNEKGYYFTLLLFGLFAAVTLQKTVRDRLEQIPVTSIYYGLCWFALLISLILLLVGLWNATLPNTEKGFYLMAYALSLFGAITAQKNVRDMETLRSYQERAGLEVNTPLDEQEGR